MDYYVKQRIERAIDSAIAAMDGAGKAQNCITCHERRTYFPRVITLSEDNDGVVTANVTEKGDFAGAEGWIELADVAGPTSGKRLTICKKCAIRKELIEDPTPPEPIALPMPVPAVAVEAAPVAKAEEPF